MSELSKIAGRGVYVAGNDIDTDRIIPARFLKCVTFDELGPSLFFDERFDASGESKDHPLDAARHKGASILISDANFGCGSSREHAPQALMRWGIRAVIGVSFAEIFYGNCLALGIPCATATPDEVVRLQAAVEADPTLEWSLDLERGRCQNERAGDWEVRLDPGAREMLLSGRWDATSQLVSREAELNATLQRLPYLNGFHPL